MEVEIRDEYSSSIPFGILQARPVVATVLGFFDESGNVFFILQRLSHSTRAYAHNCIANQGGLQGFLVPSVVKILRNADANEMEVVTKYQHVDIEDVLN